MSAGRSSGKISHEHGPRSESGIKERDENDTGVTMIVGAVVAAAAVGPNA